jgi:hypothetical protein
MTDPRNNDDRSQARSEAAALLNVDINDMSPADGLRVDMVSALRLVIDAEQANVLSGGSADLGKLNVAVQSLIALLPGRELPAPSESHPDPRFVMWEIYKTMRERGEIDLKPLSADEEKINRLESENAQLRAALGSNAATSDAQNGGRHPVSSLSSAIDPPLSDIVPPSERAECDAGPRAGPDDPRRSTTVIEGRANPPAAKATHASPTSWDDTPNGRAWNEWRDAGGYGGPGYDRWSNRNGA